MLGLSLPLVAWALVFNSFLFYMQLHVAAFRGSSQGFGALLGLVTLTGTVFGLGFLAYLFSVEGWFLTLKLIATVSVPLIFVVFPLETWITSRLTNRGTNVGLLTDLPASLSVLGIAVTPIAAYFLYRIASDGAFRQ